jgi:hypothetical protein
MVKGKDFLPGKLIVKSEFLIEKARSDVLVVA